MKEYLPRIAVLLLISFGPFSHLMLTTSASYPNFPFLVICNVGTFYRLLKCCTATSVSTEYSSVSTYTASPGLFFIISFISSQLAIHSSIDS